MPSKFEVITTLCATLFGATLFAAAWWLTGPVVREWLVEVTVLGAVLFCVSACLFHYVVNYFVKVDMERQTKPLVSDLIVCPVCRNTFQSS